MSADKENVKGERLQSEQTALLADAEKALAAERRAQVVGQIKDLLAAIEQTKTRLTQQEKALADLLSGRHVPLFDSY